MTDRAATTVRPVRVPIWVAVPAVTTVVLSVAIVTSLLMDSPSGVGARGVGAEQVVTIAMDDIAFEPAEIEVAVGTLVRLEFENSGALLHDFTIDDPAAEVVRTMGGTDHGGHEMGRAVHFALEPGARGVIEFRVTEPGEYEFYCDEPGHREAGMAGVLRVVASSDGAGDYAPPGGPGGRDH